MDNIFKNYHHIDDATTREATSSLARRVDLIEERLDFMVDKFKELEELIESNKQVQQPKTTTKRKSVKRETPASKILDL